MNENATDNVELLHKGTGILYFLCIVVGVFTGIIVSWYRLVLDHMNEFRMMITHRRFLAGPEFIFILWSGFIVIGFIVQYITKKYPRISGSGIPQVKAIILRQLEYTNWFVELVAKFVSGVLSIGAGLSLGREGPSVQIGSYVAYGANKIFKRDIVEKKYLITSGASAGLSSAFGAPISGVMFAIEELHRFISGKLLICAFLASIAADFVRRRMFNLDTSFNLIAKYPSNLNPYYQFMLYVILGIIIAVLGKLFTVSLLTAQDIYATKKVPTYMKVMCIMSSSLLLCYFLPEATGGGHSLVESMLKSKNVIWVLALIFFVKLLFTAASYSTGWAGGIFLPMLVLGAVIGKIFALVLMYYFNFPPGYIPHFMVLGMAGYFVAVVRAPLTGIFLILEMTGNFNHLLALAMVSVVAFYVTGLLGVEPIYDILYERMPKDTCDEECDMGKKTLITIPVLGESDYDGKKVCELGLPPDTLVVCIKRSDREIIPRGNTVIRPGDLIVLLLPKSVGIQMKEYYIKKGLPNNDC